jgi:hypothetical protein
MNDTTEFSDRQVTLLPRGCNEPHQDGGSSRLHQTIRIRPPGRASEAGGRWLLLAS